MAVTETHVYWTSGVDHGALLAWERGGDEPKVLYDGMPAAMSLAPGPGAMFVGSGRGVERAPLVGLGGALMVHEREGAHRVSVDGEDLFWLVRPSGVVRRADVRGRGVATLAEGRPWGNDLVVSRDAIFWTSGEPGRLSRIDRGGGTAAVLVDDLVGLGPLAVAGDHLYFSHATGVSRMPLEGGSREVVADGRSSPSALCPVGSGVCWSEQGPRGEGRIVHVTAAGEERAFQAGHVLAMAVEMGSARSLWWMDGDAKALRTRRL